MREFPGAQADGGLVGQRQVDGARVLPIVQRAERGAQNGLGLAELGQVGDDVQEACGGVLAEQHPLRTLQCFHALDVDEICHRADGPRDGHAVDGDAHGLFQSVAVGAGVHTAHAERAVAGGAGGIELQAGHQALEVRGVRQILGLQRRLRDDGYGDRHVLDVLTALGGRDHDLVQRGRAGVGDCTGGFGGGGPERRCAHHAREASTGDAPAFLCVHSHCQLPEVFYIFIVVRGRTGVPPTSPGYGRLRRCIRSVRRRCAGTPT